MQVNTIYDKIKTIAQATKSQKLSSEEITSKYLLFVDDGLKDQVFAKLDKNGFVTRSSKCDSNFLHEAKSHFDINFLSSCQKDGYYKYTPSAEYLDKIVNDPDNNESTKLFVESDTKLDGKYQIYNPTINNSNESSRRQVAIAKKLMESASAKKIAQ